MPPSKTLFRPAELAEKRLLDAIISGDYPINSSLPPERELADTLGVTRPTLREALQRLSREGWIEIHQGKSTRVRDYWQEGNLLILNTLACRPETLPPKVVAHLLQARIALAPAYARLALINSREELENYLQKLKSLPDTPHDYADVDQALHHQLTLLSRNPVFTLIMNSFEAVSHLVGLSYFSSLAARQRSKEFYLDLLAATEANRPDLAEKITREMMQESLSIWKRATETHLEE